jgi:hypothetical protein
MQPDICIPIKGDGNFLPLTNNSGNTNIRPTASVQTMGIEFGGVARTSVLTLKSFGRYDGDRLTVICYLPLTAGIIIEFRNRRPTGDLLLPEERFPDQQFVTDGFSTMATFDFVLEETGEFRDLNWNFVSANSPS